MTLLSPERQHDHRALMRDAVSDDRGAILVMGIFMCCCMVGMLWYLAGIGDAIVFRERMREASDAVAFSAAVLHARGMNLIVLLNLVMACILAIRVALKILKIIIVVLMAIFTPLCAVGVGCPIAGALKAGNVYVGRLLKTVKKPINLAIKGLHNVQKVVKYAVPPAAVAGSYQVGTRYRTLVQQSAALGPGTVKGLPVTDDTADKLCEMAGRATAHFMLLIVPGLDGIKSRIEDMTGKIVSTAGNYFCEIGTGSDSTPDLSGLVNELGFGRSCRKKQQKLQRDLNSAEYAYDRKCAEYSTVCPLPENAEDTATQRRLMQLRQIGQDAQRDYSQACAEYSEESAEYSEESAESTRDCPLPRDKVAMFTPGQQKERQSYELGWLEADVDNRQRHVDSFSQSACEREMKKTAQDNLNGAMGDESTSSSTNGKDMVPMKLKDDWTNGDSKAQMIGVSYGDTWFLEYSPKLVKIGSWENEIEVTVPVAGKLDVSQAEFFYDCNKKWESDACKEGDPMWHFRWRARLRRFNGGGNDNATAIVGGALGAEAYFKAVGAFSVDTLTFQNAKLYPKLLEAAAPKDNIVH